VLSQRSFRREGPAEGSAEAPLLLLLLPVVLDEVGLTEAVPDRRTVRGTVFMAAALLPAATVSASTCAVFKSAEAVDGIGVELARAWELSDAVGS
jgi:hypothetical protein